MDYQMENQKINEIIEIVRSGKGWKIKLLHVLIDAFMCYDMVIYPIAKQKAMEIIQTVYKDAPAFYFLTPTLKKAFYKINKLKDMQNDLNE